MNTVTTKAPANDSWKTWRQIVERANQDAVFKKRLLAEPVTVVNEHGLEVPPGFRISLVEKPDKELELTVLKKISSGELGEDDLKAVTGGQHCVTVKTDNATVVHCVSGIDAPDKTIDLTTPAPAPPRPPGGFGW